VRTGTVEFFWAAGARALGLAVVAVRQIDGGALDHQRRDQMVMSVLEAHVPPANWDALRQSYEARARVLPPQIVESFLAQSVADSTIWRILTVWRSREALDQVRQSGETPTGVLIFRDAGAEPALTIFTVWANPHAESEPARQ